MLKRTSRTWFRCGVSSPFVASPSQRASITTKVLTRTTAHSQCHPSKISILPISYQRIGMATAAVSTEIPQPQATCPSIEASEVMQLLEELSAAEKHKARDFLLVDVRRTDWEGGTITTSINFPAQSFYQTRSIVYQLCKQAGIKRVFFYCGEKPNH